MKRNATEIVAGLLVIGFMACSLFGLYVNVRAEAVVSAFADRCDELNRENAALRLRLAELDPYWFENADDGGR